MECVNLVYPQKPFQINCTIQLIHFEIFFLIYI